MKILLFFLVLLFPNFLNIGNKTQFIVWNVGQGQWVTLSTSSTCLHIDMGGEHWDKNALKKECGQKQNQVLFTHSDWDHISFLVPLTKLLPALCKASRAPVHFKRAYIRKTYEQLRFCTPDISRELLTVAKEDFKNRNGRSPKLSANDLSYIWLIGSQILIPGDSTKRAERHWINGLSHNSKIRYLILGHHGSNTSTSKALLKRLTHLKSTFVSARRRRYGHPHPQVLTRLKEFNLPVISTESWGNLRVEL